MSQASSSSSRQPSPSSSPRLRSHTVSSSSTMSSSGIRTPPNLHQNSIDPAATWVVQKYGGTSVGKFAAKIAEEIVPTYLDQHKVAIVCSARSGSTKALGTTNLLLRAASEALQRTTQPSGLSGLASPPMTPTTSGVAHNKVSFLPRKDSVSSVSSITGALNGLTMTQMSRARAETPNTGSPRSPSASPSPFSSITAGATSQTLSMSSAQPFLGTVDLLKLDHLTAARASIRDQSLLKELESEIERDCEGLRSFLFAAQIIDEISPRSRDNIVGVGERLACKLVAAVLRDRGVDAEFVSLENVVPTDNIDIDSTEGGGGSKEQNSLDQSFYDRVAEAVGERIRQCGARVPVCTGFFGPVPGSLLRQVGRGYTDLLAALAAVGLSASELQIWKEVDGIFTADPRKVPTARLIPVISPDEAAELTYYGSEVVHPFTMEQVIRRKIPIRIKNVENPSGGGTVIHPDPDSDASTAQLEMSSALSDFIESPPALALERKRKLPTAVTIKENITVLNVHSNRKSVSHGFFARIFGTLDKFGVVVDLISTSEVHVSMAIENGLGKRMVDRLVKELQTSGSVTVHPDMAILSLVGKQMRNLVGIAGRMFTTLAEGDVNIEMISQGASEINISCVIDGRDAIKALNLIHQSCLQIRPDNGLGRAAGPWLF